MEPAALSAIASLRDTEAAGARHGGRAPTIRVEVTTAATSWPPGAEPGRGWPLATGSRPPVAFPPPKHCFAADRLLMSGGSATTRLPDNCRARLPSARAGAEKTTGNVVRDALAKLTGPRDAIAMKTTHWQADPQQLRHLRLFRKVATQILNAVAQGVPRLCAGERRVTPLPLQPQPTSLLTGLRRAQGLPGLPRQPAGEHPGAG